MNDDLDLKAIRALDHDALAVVFDRYAPILYKYALRLCHDPVEADQIVGDVFARFLEKLSAGQGPRTNVRSYLFQITYHIVVDHARERQRTAPLEVAIDIRDEEAHFTSQVEEKMTLEAVSRVMDTELTDEQRQVLILRFQEEFSLKETAKIIGKNVNATKALQNRGVAKLRQVLNQMQTSNDQ